MRTAESVLLVVVLVVVAACNKPMSTKANADAAAQPDAGRGADAAGGSPDAGDASAAASADSSAGTVDATRLSSPDSSLAVDGTPPARCASQSTNASSPVSGTVRGRNVEGEVCNNGVGTDLYGPNDVGVTYQQNFTTTAPIGSKYGTGGTDFYGFLLRKPADALFANFTGYAGASAPEKGTYDSTTNCGYLKLDVTLPIPPGVACPTELSPCDPGCAPMGGEMMICQPLNPVMHYLAASGASCGSVPMAPQGSWVLAITEVTPLANPAPYLKVTDHGHLDATLINQDDPSDSIVLSLDF